MYQSVFVIAEERRECVIATEVSQKFSSADRPCEMHHVVPSEPCLTGAPTVMTANDEAAALFVSISDNGYSLSWKSDHRKSDMHLAWLGLKGAMLYCFGAWRNF